MSDQSQTTQPAETESSNAQQTETVTTPPTSSTTPPSQETAKSSETTDGSTLGTEPKKAETEAKPGEKKPEAKPGAPEKYEAWTMPEGYEVDAKVMGDAEGVFREIGLSQEQGQKLVNWFSKNAIESSNQSLQAVKDMRAGWVKELATSPEYSREFDASGKIKADSQVLVGMGRMLDSLGDPKLARDFRQALDLTGAGDHPAFFRVMDRLAKSFAEGTSVRGRGPSPHGTDQPSTRRSAAQEMYPKLPSAGA